MGHTVHVQCKSTKQGIDLQSAHACLWKVLAQVPEILETKSYDDSDPKDNA